MAHFDQKDIKALQKLCRIRCTEEEEKQLFIRLQKVLAYIELLNEIDTSKVEPCDYVLKDAPQKPLREDVEGEILSPEAFLQNTPEQIGKMVRVPPILNTQ